MGEILGPATELPSVDILLRLMAAVVCGLFLGIDRELRGKAAGMRTHMLVSLAAATFTILTFEIYHQVTGENESAAADPFCPHPERLWAEVLRRQPGSLAWASTRPVDPTLN